MEAQDRPEFDRQIETLCAAFNVPVSVRPEAYWHGLQRMGMIEFARVIEWALAEDSPHPDKIPTVGQIWVMRKALRNRRAAAQPVQQRPAEQADHIAYFANRLMLSHVLGRSGMGSESRFIPAHGVTDASASDELRQCRAETKSLVDWFVGLTREADPEATPRKFIVAFVAAMKRHGEIAPRVLDRLREKCADPASSQPFPQHMARAL